MSKILYIFAILILFFIIGKSNNKSSAAQIKNGNRKNKKATLYDILNVSTKATLAEIKKSYRALAKKCHPDLNPDKKQAEKQFRELNEAYKILTDKQKRADYDAKLNAPKKEKFTKEKIWLRAKSIQELRIMIAQCLNISPGGIKFTHDGTVFIDGQYAFCWRPIKIENARYHPLMKFHLEFYTELYFEYYRPLNPQPCSQNDDILEKILLTAPDTETLQASIGQCYNRDPNNIFLTEDGMVYVDGKQFWNWRYTCDGYLEYYVPAGDASFAFLGL